MKKILFFLLISALAALAPASARAETLEKPYDHSLWDSFLKKYVNEKGEVNFAAAKQDPKLLNDYLAQLRTLNEIDFAQWPREEVMALWINAYHAAAIATVIKHYPVKSMQDIPSAWDTEVLQLTNRGYSLNFIRKEMLLSQFHDEKVHFALSDMTKSGPVLSRDAYTGPLLDGQLFMAARKFVNDPERNVILSSKKKVELSKIFKWYGADFTFNFGKPDNDRGLSREEFSFLSFISYYLENAEKAGFLEEGRYKIKYLPYDWSLNDWKA